MKNTVKHMIWSSWINEDEWRDDIKNECEENFPDNPKDEYREARGIKRKFYIYKFRSMIGDAEKNGAQFSSKNDSRITKVGNFLGIIYLCVLKRITVEKFTEI